jgi:hypothetical protein
MLFSTHKRSLPQLLRVCPGFVDIGHYNPPSFSKEVLAEREPDSGRCASDDCSVFSHLGDGFGSTNSRNLQMDQYAASIGFGILGKAIRE